mmetsp:Transcript_42236/g.70438  ORF Transcript_42236/g.70438 Transcript_42236/m.70438 type:complete len:416 (+) Transcript_42236:16-1263(+)
MVEFLVEYAKSGRSKCKATKTTISKGEVRIGKVTESPFGDGDMTTWFSIDGFVIANARARKHTLESVDDLIGFDDLKKKDQKYVRETLKGGGGGKKATSSSKTGKRKGSSKKSKPAKKAKTSSSGKGGISGKAICVTGKITGMTRAVVQAKILGMGGIVKKSVTKSVDILVAGPGSGSKLDLAEAYGIEVWNEDKLFAALGISSESKEMEESDEDDEEEEEEEEKLEEGGSIKGKTVCITGKITGMTRKEAEREIKKLGGIPKSSITKSLDILVAGKDTGSKLDLAKAYKIKIWDEDTFFIAAGLKSAGGKEKDDADEEEADDEEEAMEEDEDEDEDEDPEDVDLKGIAMAYMEKAGKFWEIRIEKKTTYVAACCVIPCLFTPRENIQEYFRMLTTTLFCKDMFTLERLGHQGRQ